MTPPSKTFNLAGLQTSYFIISNNSIRAQYSAELQNSDLIIPNNFGIEALQTAYTECSDWLTELLKYLKSNYEFAKDFLSRHLSKIKIISPQATFLLWLV